jgi:hypothetical protein
VKGKPAASGKSKSSNTHARLPSLTPLPAPLPLQTIQLDIKLGGPNNYEVVVSELAGPVAVDNATLRSSFRACR